MKNNTYIVKKYYLLCLSLFIIPCAAFAQLTENSWQKYIKNSQGNYIKIKQILDEQKALKIEQKLRLGDNKNNSEEKEDEFNQFYKWEAMIKPHLDNKGNFNLQKETQNIEEYFKINQTSTKNARTASVANWQALGPFNSPKVDPNYADADLANIGLINDIAFHPTDINKFYIGTPTGGVFKTIDGGKTWSYLSKSWTTTWGGISIAINPLIPSTIYALNSAANVLYKSIDEGLTWTKNATPQPNSKLLINPVNPNIMLFGTSNGLALSSDEGNSWALAVGISKYVYDLAFMPGNPNIVYALYSTYQSGQLNEVLGVLCKSTDGGKSFNDIYKFPIDAGGLVIAVTPAAPNNIYLSAVKPAPAFYIPFQPNLPETTVYISKNGGISFIAYTSKNTYNDFAYDNGQRGYCYTLNVSPTNPDEIWIGLVGAYRTTDGGATWKFNQFSTTKGGAALHSDIHKIAIQPVSGKLFISTDGGLYRSTTSNDNYEILSGMNNTQIYTLGGLQNDANTVVIATQDNGAKLYKNGTFENIGGILDLTGCIIDPTNPNIIYLSDNQGSLTKINLSNVLSNFDDTVITPNPLPTRHIWELPFVMSPSDSKTLFAGYENLYKTTDGGNSWSIMTNYVTNTNKLGITDAISIIKIAENNANIIYSGSEVYINGTRTIILQKSIDGGTTWNVLNHPINFIDLAIDPSNASIVWGVGLGKIYQSTDGGTTWIDKTGTFPNIAINTIKIDKNSHDVYLGAYAGVYVWNNKISDWQIFNTNLPNVSINKLDITYADGGKIRAATWGLGLWESPLLSSIPISISLGTLPTSACAGDSISVPFTITGVFNAGNTFTAQLINASKTVVSSTLGKSSPLKMSIPKGMTSGVYNLRVISSSPVFTEDSSKITVTQPVAIISSNAATTPSTLSANTGNGLTYQWLNNGKSISGANLSTYLATIEGNYSVVVTQNSCSISSNILKIITPFISLGTVLLNACAGDSISIPFTPTGFFNLDNIFTAQLINTSKIVVNSISGTNSPLKIGIPKSTTSGDYKIRVISSSPVFTNDSAKISLTLSVATITSNSPTAPATLNANTGTGFTYQWLNNGKTISGAISSSYLAMAEGNYSVVVTQNACSATSINVQVEVITATEEEKETEKNNLLIYSNPANRSVTIQYTLEQSGGVGLFLSDTRGKAIKTIIELKYHNKGIYTLPFDISNLTEGIYYFTIKSNYFTQSQRLSVVR